MDRIPTLGDVQGGGPPDPIQLCRCHTTKCAPKGQILYKLRHWGRLKNKDTHFPGCPTILAAAARGEFVLSV